MPVSSKACRISPSKPTVGKLWMPAKPSARSSSRNSRDHERICAVHAREHRRLVDDRKDLEGHLLDDLIRVPVRQQAGRAPAARHPVAARVVDDQEIDPPASSLLAERPVPAPPPMIGSPRATCSRNRFRMPCLELSTVTNTSPGPRPSGFAMSAKIARTTKKCQGKPFAIFVSFATFATEFVRLTVYFGFINSSSLRAAASANSGSLMWRSSSMTSAPRKPERIASWSARRASGSSKGWPSLSMADTPRAGSRTDSGPVETDSFRAMSAPILAFSSRVVASA